MKMETKRDHGQLYSYIKKTDFKPNTVICEKEVYYIVIKASINQDDITIIKIYVFNFGTLKNIKQMLTDLQGEIYDNTIIAEDFNTHSQSRVDYLARKSIKKHYS